MNRNFFILNLLLCFSIRFGIAQNIEIANWELTPNQSKIEDKLGNYHLTKSVSTAEGTITGYADRYSSSFDINDNGFSLEGYFKTKGKTDAVMAIAGNRSSLSGYTGWDFVMLKTGILRFVLAGENKTIKTLFSSQRPFDDGNEHFFTIKWEPKTETLSMVIDKKYNYSIKCENVFTTDSNRLFYIGAQPSLNGGKSLLFKGELRNFIFKGAPMKDKKEQGDKVSTPSLESLDRELATQKNESATVLWTDAKSLTIEGMGWRTGIDDYTRLPQKYNSIVTPKVWTLSRHSSGITVRFIVTGTNTISAKWTLRGNGYMAHMAPQAVNGLDLYVKQNGKWVWAGVGKPSKDGLQQEVALKGGFAKDRTYECMLYLPLYSGVTSLQVGASIGAKVIPATPNTKKPFVFYGTSILHGCSASRAGMSFSSMLGRRFDTPIVNLGFSGNGLMEEHFASVMGEIEASIYFIDCLPNMAGYTPKEITDRTLALVKALRKIRPSTPIVLVEDRTYAYADLLGMPAANPRRPAMKAAYNELMKKMSQLYYVEGNQLLGDDTEATVDGSHPSDLGMYRYYTALVPVIEKISYKH